MDLLKQALSTNTKTVLDDIPEGKKLLKILTYPNPKLRGISAPIPKDANQENINNLVSLMRYAMEFYGGVGLAAPQVGVHYRLLLVSRQTAHNAQGVDGPLTMLNPEIVHLEGTQSAPEGCLSFPGIRAAHVLRGETVIVQFEDLERKHNELELTGFQAQIVQHEIDHLNGILFIDKVSRLKKDMILQRYKKTGRL